METLSFAFGMLSMIAVALVTVVVVGMVKVSKIKTELSQLSRIVDELESNVHQRISNEVDDINIVIENDRRELNQRIDEAYGYVDSRFDKMENKFIGASAAKQIIND